ncbi:MAG: 7-carboxy-7-deazaguanine synthase QueE, partial [Muribaculaceae bacterium]|nr:7-carboxy-7-deazaguanine synthase QueE [Muribaculaceae bacterium]
MMRVNEIFYSIQGEGAHTGVPAVFVRLSGCNLRCPFCDTDFNSGEEMTSEEIAAAVNAYPARHVIITGGEPTLQLDVRISRMMKNNGKNIQMEKNGFFNK